MIDCTKKHFVVLAIILGISAFIVTCNQPMGLGKAIDWESPVLTLDPGPNPRYVRMGATLTGTVSDNVGVDRVILREASSGDELFEAVLTPVTGKSREWRWEIALEFTDDDNDKKIAVEIVAYDSMENSGEPSIATVTLIIDLRPPKIDDSWMQRAPMKTAVFESYAALKELETLDPRGEKTEYVNRYQNGWFRIHARVSEDETRIENVVLKIYEEDEQNIPLLTLQKDVNSTSYAPYWLIKEEELLSDTSSNDIRHYFRVEMVAFDRSENESVEDQGWLCLWPKNDEPRGLYDLILGTTVFRGTPLPVLFFDDDSIEWIYTGLFTRDQWNGDRVISASGLRFPKNTNDDGKLVWLKEKLTAGETIYNWKSDKEGYSSHEPFVELIGGKSIDEKWVYVPSGEKETDYGEYVLFALVGDKKLEPHDGNGPRETNINRWSRNSWAITLVDDNNPLIVFDTVDTTPGPNYDPGKHPGSEPDNEDAQTGNSPEENTFPRLSSDPSDPEGGGRYFTINGYILRENKSGNNGIKNFRMAWIPYMDGEADSYVQAVQEALQRGSGYPAGVQYWHFTPDPEPGEIKLIEGTPEAIGESPYRKQVFKKTFDILGGADDIRPSWNNFSYNGARENETKLFVFYAEDTIGHTAFRTLRLLANKTPPDLTVYDISNRSGLDEIKPPILNDYDKTTEGGNGNGTIEPNERNNYIADLTAYQKTAYDLIWNTPVSDDDKNRPYVIYTRGTTLKYKVMAEKSGDLAVAEIFMDDITSSEDTIVDVGHYVSENRALSYCETLPEVTQRVFLFTAEDTLGNKAQIQRTVAVTSTAVLSNISTTEQTGDYGIGKVITLQANFSGQVYYTGAPPQLNIRYQLNGADVISQLNTKTPANTTRLALEFDFIVPEGAGGKLETMHETSTGGDAANESNRPLRLPNRTEILDFERKEPAFVPGYNLPPWTNETYSLQEYKDIRLDGTRPVIDGPLSVTVTSGKAPYPIGGDTYYFKADESIGFTLKASKPIEPSGSPRIRFNIGSNGPYYADWQQRSSIGPNEMYFTVTVGTATPADGQIGNLSVDTTINPATETVGKIVDLVGNELVLQSLSLPSGWELFIDRTPPPAPAFTLRLSGGNVPNVGVNPDTVININQNPTLVIPETVAQEPYGVTRSYSLNGGLIWIEYTAEVPIGGGTHDLVTRYIDRAGNMGAQARQKIQVNAEFPKLISVTAEQPNGTYTRGQSLSFILGFDDVVTVPNGTAASITLGDRTLTGQYRTVTLNAVANTTPSSTVIVNWPLSGDWEMPNGLYVSAVNFTGLRDRFTNAGVSSTAATNTSNIVMPNTGDVAGTYNCSNLSAGLIVDTVNPSVTTYAPANAQGRNDISTSVSADNKTITLTFREPVMVGNGTITVKPYGNYRIPPVFEDNGYTNGDGTWVAGFYDIYNTSGLTAADRNALTEGTTVSGNSNSTVLDTSNPSMSRLRLDPRTGQSVGPYIRMTQGLIAGAGYTGNYSNIATAPHTGTNAYDGPNPQPGFMVPDTATKWVLDYRYSIDNANNTSVVDTDNAVQAASNTVVPAIRAVLTKAKWRWQELDVISSSIEIVGNDVIITLTEPLHKGLQWSLHYPEGTFTDAAGNKAPALSYQPNGTTISTDTATTSYWFWSNGVQTPVIRVNRKSFDARNTNWVGPFIPAGNSGAQANTVINNRYGVPAYVDGPGGWGIDNFNTVYYRIETETPGNRVRIFYNTIEGKNVMHPTATTVPVGSVIVAGGTSNVNWGVTVQYGGTADNTTAGRNWNSNDNSTNGEWVRPNLIRRGSAGNRNYDITPEYGHPVVTRTIQGTYYGYRSHNKDATKTELDAISLDQPINSGISNGLNSFGYTALEASKNYVVAEARIDHQNENYTSATGTSADTSARGYEGVFRSVIAMMQGGTNNAVLTGSNVLKGMPTITGFPVRDTAESGDARYVKIFYRDGQQSYWVSTEIVSQWYMLKWGQGTHQNVGDANNQLTAGYGDLSFAYLLTSFNNTP
jgi:hypothetical protein